MTKQDSYTIPQTKVEPNRWQLFGSKNSTSNGIDDFISDHGTMLEAADAGIKLVRVGSIKWWHVVDYENVAVVMWSQSAPDNERRTSG